MDNRYKIGMKVRVVHDIATVDGMLHKDEIVKIDGLVFPDTDIRAKDSLGKIWYINFCDVSLIS
jgi:plastocyanin domain-containing protein